MASIEMRDVAGKKAGSVDLPAEIFESKVSVPLMHQVVVAGLAGIRAGTHSTKTRAEVRGGGRKPWRQKGTGRARQGSIRSPQWVGGGVAHGPTPRDHSQKVNKKMRRGSLRSALTDALQSGKLAVVDELDWSEPKTKQAVGVLESLELAGRILLVLPAAHGVRDGREVVPEPLEREDRLHRGSRDLRHLAGGPRAVHGRRDRPSDPAPKASDAGARRDGQPKRRRRRLRRRRLRSRQG